MAYYNKVRAASHDLAGKSNCHNISKFVDALKIKEKHTLKAILTDINEFAASETLAEKHTEHWRSLRIIN